jgi:hypothetical protein
VPEKSAAMGMLREAAEGLPGPADRPLRFVLDHGREFRPAPLPPGFRKGEPRRCFANAQTLALTRPGVLYCEGYGFIWTPGGGWLGLPISHGWCCRPGGRRAVEVNCDNFHAYAGVVFRAAYLKKLLVKGGLGCSLIDAWRRDWPLLSMAPAELGRAIYPGRRRSPKGAFRAEA